MSNPNINVNVSGPIQPESVYKTKVLRGNQPFADQIGEANTKYVIKHNFDLQGGTVNIPAGCILEFDGGSLKNGVVIGQQTVTNKLLSVFDGDFYYNGEYHNFQSLIINPIEFEYKKCIFHKQFVLKSYFVFNNCDVSGINAKVDVDGALQESEKNLVSIIVEGGVFHNNIIEFNNDSTAVIENDVYYDTILVKGAARIENNIFRNYNSAVYKAANIINVYYTALPVINGCVFENLTAVSDGNQGAAGPGTLRAINHRFLLNDDYYGVEEISNCTFKNIKSVNAGGTEVMDDCDGIYFAGTNTTGGVTTITHHRDYIVRGCNFVNVRKRSIKIQSQGVKIYDCSFFYDSALASFVGSIIGLMAYDVIICNSRFVASGAQVLNATNQGKIIIKDSSITAGYVVLDSSVDGTEVELTDCNVSANYIYYRAAASTATKDNVKCKDCVVDANILGNPRFQILYDGCIINTTRLKTNSYASHAAFDCSIFKDCIINFDVTGISANVYLVGYDKYINMKECTVNVDGPSDFGYTINLFKSSYNAAGGKIYLNGLKFYSPCLEKVTFFASITQNLSEESYIGNIDMSGTATTQNITINTGSASVALLKFENIKIDANNGQLLWLYGCNNLYFKNIYSTPMTLSSSGFKVGYQAPGKIYVENLYVKPSKANAVSTFFATFETIGSNGYVICSDEVVRRLFTFDNGEKALLSDANTSVTGDTPTLKAEDKGVSKFSTTNNKPIWWNGTAWVDATGATV